MLARLRAADGRGGGARAAASATSGSADASACVDRIDLLKIDVEGCELRVLRGVDDADWPRVAAVSAEVHDVDKRVAHVVALLESKGFVVRVERPGLNAAAAVEVSVPAVLSSV